MVQNSSTGLTEREELDNFKRSVMSGLHRESVTLEFPGDRSKERISHRRQNSSCLVHELLEINNLQDKATKSHANLTNLTSENTDVSGYEAEPMTKTSLSQLVVSVRDLSQSLSK